VVVEDQITSFGHQPVDLQSLAPQLVLGIAKEPTGRHRLKRLDIQVLSGHVVEEEGRSGAFLPRSL
jgi:hypothetical protein